MKIILIDDSKLMLAIAKKTIIENFYRIEIEAFTNPVLGFERICENNVDLVIIDLIMDKMSGIDMIKGIKNNDKLKHIKILVLTGVADYSVLTQCFELGVSDYITKPFNEYELIARVKNALREIGLQKKLAERIKNIKSEHKELVKANENLKITQSRLVQKEQMAGIGRLAAGIAHEINNPLGFVLSNFNTLSDYMEFIGKLMNKYDELKIDDKDVINYKIKNDYDFIVDDITEIIKDTNSGLNRVKEIVKSLKNFSRIDAFKEFSDYDVNEGIKETLIISKNEYKYIADVDIELNEIPHINAFGGEINQVILNLIINAGYAIKKKNETEIENKRGLISVRTTSTDKDIIIEISDDGCGMDKNTVTKIFTPFYTTKPVGTGTGLGLSITYDIIKNKHNGVLEVESSVGIGTKFTVILPIEQS
jgi:signal transduction histidine kinase